LAKPAATAPATPSWRATPTLPSMKAIPPPSRTFSACAPGASTPISIPNGFRWPPPPPRAPSFMTTPACPARSTSTRPPPPVTISTIPTCPSPATAGSSTPPAMPASPP